MLKRALYALLILGLPVGGYAQEAPSGSQVPSKKAERESLVKPRAPRAPASAGPVAPPPEPTSDPMEILERAAEASKRLKRVFYEGRVRGSGTLAADVPSTWGTAVLGDRSSASTEKFRIMVPGSVPGSSGLLTAMAGSDGKVFFLVDVQKETVTESKDRAVIGDREQMLRYFAIPELMHKDPFGKAKKADKVEFKRYDEVNGIACYVVHVSNADGTEQTDWFFSTTDSLPRRVDRIKVDSTGKTGTISLTMERLIPNPIMQQDPFTKFVPEGYKVR